MTDPMSVYMKIAQFTKCTIDEVTAAARLIEAEFGEANVTDYAIIKTLRPDLEYDNEKRIWFRMPICDEVALELK